MHIELRSDEDSEKMYLRYLAGQESRPEVHFDRNPGRAFRMSDKLMVLIFNEIVSGRTITFFPGQKCRIALVGERDVLESSGVINPDGTFKADAT